MEVRFTDWAENCLKEVYNHYSEEVGPDKAAEIVNKRKDLRKCVFSKQTSFITA